MEFGPKNYPPKTLFGFVLCIFYLILFFLEECHAQGAIDIAIGTSPRNIAVLKNDTASFTCSITQREALDNFGVASFEERITSSVGLAISYDDHIVYTELGGDEERASRYSIFSPSSREFVLNITGVKMADGGKYSCVARNQANIYRTAELIVLEDHPKCTTDAVGILQAGDLVTMTCHVQSHGRWRPEIEWSTDGSGTVTPATQHSRTQGSVYSETKNIIIDENDHGRVYVARTYFMRPTGLGDHEAMNAPSYQFIHQFDPLRIRCNCTTITSSPLEPVTDDASEKTTSLSVMIFLLLHKIICY